MGRVGCSGLLQCVGSWSQHGRHLHPTEHLRGCVGCCFCAPTDPGGEEVGRSCTATFLSLGEFGAPAAVANAMAQPLEKGYFQTKAD